MKPESPELNVRIRGAFFFCQKIWEPIQSAINAIFDRVRPVAVENGGLDVEYTAQGARLKISDSVLDAINAAGTSGTSDSSDDSGSTEYSLSVTDAFSPVLWETYDDDGNVSGVECYLADGTVSGYTSGSTLTVSTETAAITASGRYYAIVTFGSTGLPASASTTFATSAPSGDLVVPVASVTYDATAKTCSATRLRGSFSCAKFGNGDVFVW